MNNFTNEELEWVAYLAGDYLLKNDYINLSRESARNVISNIRFKAQQAILGNLFREADNVLRDDASHKEIESFLKKNITQ